MSDEPIVWTTSELPPPDPEIRGRYTTAVLGLLVEVHVQTSYISASARGVLDEFPVAASTLTFRVTREALEEAKDQAVRAARRLYAAGVRGEVQQPSDVGDAALREESDRREAQESEEGSE